MSVVTWQTLRIVERTRYLVPPPYLFAGGHDCDGGSTSPDPVTSEHDGHAMSVVRNQSLVWSSFHFDVGGTSTVWARLVNVHNYSSTTLVSTEHYGGVTTTYFQVGTGRKPNWQSSGALWGGTVLDLGSQGAPRRRRSTYFIQHCIIKIACMCEIALWNPCVLSLGKHTQPINFNYILIINTVSKTETF